MRWFTGPIQDAITTAKHDRKIFLVFVEGKDETSKNMAETITEEEISGLVDENCVSIKLTTDSEPFRQFSQIYPVIVVPSMFFIGNNGIPLEVIAGSENRDDLVLKIHKAIQLHKAKHKESDASASTAAAASSSPPPEAVAAEKSSPDTKQDAGAATQNVETPSDHAVQDAPQGDMQEADAQALLKQKLERAEQLMAERRRMREKEEKEAEKERELEQRRVSREMQKAREQMKEKEMADWAKQRQKEKQEDKAARQRVLAQIAQDKADRAAKLQNSGSPPPAAPQSAAAAAASSSSSSSVRQRSHNESASSSQVARIQFRLPNSETSNHEFPSGATVRDVIRHIEQVIKPNLSGFSLATSFPRRHFTKADHNRTLLELDLCPSAVLLVLPASAANPAQHSSGGGFWALLWTILSPLTLMWNFIYSFVFGNQRREALPSSSPPPAQPQPPTAGQGPSASRQESSRNKSEPNQKPPSANSARYRKDGNVHRLSNESSNDDEDGTWNGNSTQQM